jgi:hypothetical protein
MAATIQLSHSGSIANTLNSTPSSLQASPMNSRSEYYNELYTIDSLLRARASGTKATGPFVAYPSTGMEYTFYNPSQVSPTHSQ